MKIVKWLAAVLVSAFMIMSLSSCKALDEARERSAYWADETHTAISWLGNTYLMTNLNPEELGIRLYGPQIYVNTTDVPVLMRSYEGLPFRADKQKRLLYAETDYDISLYQQSGGDRKIVRAGTLFVREGLAEEIEEALKNSKTDHYCTEIYLGDGEEVLLLPDDLTAMVDQALSQEKITNETAQEVDDYAKFFYDYKGSVTIFPCDESMLMRKGYINIYYWEDGTGREEGLIELDEKERIVYIPNVDPQLYKRIRAFYLEAMDSK